MNPCFSEASSLARLTWYLFASLRLRVKEPFFNLDITNIQSIGTDLLFVILWFDDSRLLFLARDRIQLDGCRFKRLQRAGLKSPRSSYSLKRESIERCLLQCGRVRAMNYCQSRWNLMVCLIATRPTGRKELSSGTIMFSSDTSISRVVCQCLAVRPYATTVSRLHWSIRLMCMCIAPTRYLSDLPAYRSVTDVYLLGV